MVEIANQLPELLYSTSRDAYVVGGAVRDLLVGVQPEDIDIAVVGDPHAYSAWLAQKTQGHVVRLGRPGLEIDRVVAGDRYYDVAKINGATIAEDLIARDFTLNAMAWDLDRRRLIDPCGGRADIDRHRVRMVSEEGLVRDPLRLLRAFRLSAAFGFSVESATLEAIRQHAPLIQGSAGERIRVELLKLLSAAHSADHLETMADCRLLDAVFPELASARGCRQNRYHAFDVLTHTLMAYRQLEEILKGPERFFPEHGIRIRRTISPRDTVALKLAMLLHDIGKPESRRVSFSGDITFYGHPQAGARGVREIGRRLRLSKWETDSVEAIVAAHLRPLLLFKARRKGALSSKAVFRFFRAAGRLTSHILIHTAADCMGKGWEADTDSALNGFLSELLGDFFDHYAPGRRRKPLVNGNDLMDRFGLAPSPLIGRLLTHLEAARFAGRVETREAAMAAAAQWLKQHASETDWKPPTPPGQ